ncbi:MAG: hypothetical protein HUU20_05335, partial [Pirellulales bacterium]|nr:hypothetical protein [Pirellulales bacterium]
MNSQSPTNDEKVFVMESLFTQGGECQCVYPDECGDAGGCGLGISAVDLATPFGFGHARFFNERLISTCDPECEPVNFDFGNGYNWLASDWPYVLDKCGPPVIVVLPPRRMLRFCINETTPYGEYDYVYKAGGCGDCPDPGFADPKEERSADQLRYEFFYAEDQFTLKDADGSIWRFLGFRPDRAERGRFKSFESGSLKAEVTAYTSEGHIGHVHLSEEKIGEGDLSYSYALGSDGVERLTRVEYTGPTVDGKEAHLAVEYTYYGSGDPHGSLGDLKTATQEQFLGGAWVATDTWYYRYTNVDGAHRVRFPFDPEAFERLKSDPAVSDPLTASDAKASEYANRWLEYDASARVNWESILGSPETTFSYEDGDQSDSDFNAFKLKTVATRSDGLVRTTYRNFHRQLLLEETKESASATESFLDYRQYDGDGNLVLHATPAALAGYSVSGYTVAPQYRSEGG